MTVLKHLIWLSFIALSSVCIANPDKRIELMEIELKEKGEPTANYLYAVQTGNLLFLAGHISVDSDGKAITGKVGKDLTTEQGAQAARMAGISILSTLKQQLGSLHRVNKFVKVTGMVNSTPDFTGQSAVINGFSDLMVEVFGDRGKHARSAVGMSALPVNAAVEIEVIVELTP